MVPNSPKHLIWNATHFWNRLMVKPAWIFFNFETKILKIYTDVSIYEKLQIDYWFRHNLSCGGDMNTINLIIELNNFKGYMNAVFQFFLKNLFLCSELSCQWQQQYEKISNNICYILYIILCYIKELITKQNSGNELI